MAHEWLSLDEIARQLGRDKRELEKLANRGRIPGRKNKGVWQFHSVEITHWLEQEMPEYSQQELALVESGHASLEVDAELPVSSLLSPETIAVPLQARTKRSVLESLIEVAGRTWHVWEPAIVLRAVQEREEILSTGYAGGVAIPHPRNPLPDVLGQPVIAFGRTSSGIPFGASNRGLTDLFFLVLCRDSRTHLKVLARLGRIIQSPNFLETLREQETAQETYDFIVTTDEEIEKG